MGHNIMAQTENHERFVKIGNPNCLVLWNCLSRENDSQCLNRGWEHIFFSLFLMFIKISSNILPNFFYWFTIQQLQNLRVRVLETNKHQLFSIYNVLPHFVVFKPTQSKQRLKAFQVQLLRWSIAKIWVLPKAFLN